MRKNIPIFSLNYQMIKHINKCKEYANRSVKGSVKMIV